MGAQAWAQRPAIPGGTLAPQNHTVSYITMPLNGQIIPPNPTSLPMDLENIVLSHEIPIMDLDMEAVLRHEAALTRDNQPRFDL